ncbi:MAG: hypothetical protein KC731_29870 [Myxococcales bacterium]|nr:hypothetical protein [Myxococcales bacterium]
MRLLIVGEGATEVGAGSWQTAVHAGNVAMREAGGVVTALVARVLGRELERPMALCRDRLKGSLEDKVLAAVRHARLAGLDAVVFVHDADRRRSLIAMKLEKGRAKTLARIPGARVVTGVAVETTEAWTLGARRAIAAVVGDSVDVIAELVPSDVETLSPKSGKPARASKALVELLAARANLSHIEFVEAVAAATDPAELRERCPEGFAPFAAAVEGEFGEAG